LLSSFCGNLPLFNAFDILRLPIRSMCLNTGQEVQEITILSPHAVLNNNIQCMHV